MMFCLTPQNTPHIIKLIAYLVLRYYWVILPLSLGTQGVMAIDIGFLNFSYFVREGDSKGFLRAPSVRTPYPTPPPPNISAVSRTPSHRASRPASPCQLGATVSQVKAGKLPITYTQAHTSTHASVSV